MKYHNSSSLWFMFRTSIRVHCNAIKPPPHPPKKNLKGGAGWAGCNCEYKAIFPSRGGGSTSKYLRERKNGLIMGSKDPGI